MSGQDALYRVAMTRPHDARARAGSAIVVFLVLGAIFAAVVAVPMFAG